MDASSGKISPRIGDCSQDSEFMEELQGRQREEPRRLMDQAQG